MKNELLFRREGRENKMETIQILVGGASLYWACVVVFGVVLLKSAKVRKFAALATAWV